MTQRIGQVHNPSLRLLIRSRLLKNDTTPGDGPNHFRATVKQLGTAPGPGLLRPLVHGPGDLVGIDQSQNRSSESPGQVTAGVHPCPSQIQGRQTGIRPVRYGPAATQTLQELPFEQPFQSACLIVHGQTGLIVARTHRSQILEHLIPEVQNPVVGTFRPVNIPSGLADRIEQCPLDGLRIGEPSVCQGQRFNQSDITRDHVQRRHRIIERPALQQLINLTGRTFFGFQEAQQQISSPQLEDQGHIQAIGIAHNHMKAATARPGM